MTRDELCTALDAPSPFTDGVITQHYDSDEIAVSVERFRCAPAKSDALTGAAAISVRASGGDDPHGGHGRRDDPLCSRQGAGDGHVHR